MVGSFFGGPRAARMGTLLLVSNLPPRLHPARPDLSVARALCARLRSRSAREVARRVLAA